MITPCAIYAIITLLLALVDALRIKANWGKVENISHTVSYQLAGISGGSVVGWWCYSTLLFNWWTLLAVLLVSVAFVGIRLALYDPILNLWRILFKVNPTGKIDYVSTVTSSYDDQHSEKVPFWCKRIGGALGWLLMFLLYKVIFKV